MLKLNLTGYVNSVRTNTLPSGKVVTNVKIGVLVNKKEKLYQNFDVSFWDEASIQAAKLQEKDYIHIPDVTIFSLKISDGKYININGSAFSVFKSLPLNSIPSSAEVVYDALVNSKTEEKPFDMDSIPF
jgi:hypothetical protein